jgi:hypothetical protein
MINLETVLTSNIGDFRTDREKRSVSQHQHKNIPIERGENAFIGIIIHRALKHYQLKAQC